MTTPHDALVRSAFEAPAHAAALLYELVPLAVRKAIAWETLESASGSFVDAEFTYHHSDLVFRAQQAADASEHVYFLLEHQSSSHPMMPLRGLTYQNKIWNRVVKDHHGRWLPPVIVVLVSQVPGGWRAARAFEQLLDPALMAIFELAALVPRFSMIVADLMQLSNEELAARTLPAFPKLALWLLRDARDSRRLLDSFMFWRPWMLQLGRSRARLDSLTLLIRYMFQVVDPAHLDELRAKIRMLGPRIERVAMSIADYFREEGLKQGQKQGLKRGQKQGLKRGQKQGLKQGLEKGLKQGQKQGLEKGLKQGQKQGLEKGLKQGQKQGLEKGLKKGQKQGLEKGLKKGLEKGRINALHSLLVFKFQHLSAADEARLQAATPDRIDHYLQRLLTANSLAAVFED
jgi:Putative transposase, YhgA-like